MAKMTNQEVSALVLQESQTEVERQKRKTTDRKYKALLGSYNELAKKYAELQDYRSRRISPITIKPGKPSVVNEICPAIVLSDWHAEERVEPKTIGGKNQYNLDIARKRAAFVSQNAVKRMRELSDEGTIRSVPVFLLGDFITGHIHEENVENAQLGRLDALQFAEELLTGSLEYLLAETEFEYVVYCKVGNHSRMTHRVRASTEWQNSVEPLMYWSMKRYFETKYPNRVRFHLEESYYSIANILGTRVRFHHGHAVSYGGGVGGLHIPLRKAIKSWNENERADLDIMGHYHSFLEHSTMKYVVNGSLIGYNAYAERIKCALEPPMQSMVVIHKKYGVVRLVPLFAE